jgi:hypothetical protein
MLLVFIKSLVAGYTRKDGAYVKPHSDKRARRAPLEPHQLVLFPKPTPKPIAPNPFKGLDPVKSTGDLFEHEPEHAAYNWEKGHGHVRPRADGARARCGGEATCSTCQHERAVDDAEKGARQ